MRFTKKRRPLIQDEKYLKFNKLVATAFSQRRKMLRNTLKGWGIPEEIKNKIHFIHFNHTNPAIKDSHPLKDSLQNLGFQFPKEGSLFEM